MKAVVRKWGNSASVRLPAAIMKAAHLDVNDAVDVREESGRIIIELMQRRDYDLCELVKRIHRGNVHEEVESGGPVGKEVW